MVALRLRMRPVCEQHRAQQLPRVRMHVREDNGLGHTVRGLTHVRRKIKLVRRGMQEMAGIRIEQALIIAR